MSRAAPLTPAQLQNRVRFFVAVFAVVGLVAVVVASRLSAPAELGDADGLQACVSIQTDPIGCFTRVPAGKFLMGAQSTAPDAPNFDPLAEPDEAPVHEVTLPEFFIQKQEVTVWQYSRCVEAGACDPAAVGVGANFNFGRDERTAHPVNGVTWAGADVYCKWVGARLPTEAEWERAAQGLDGARFPWGREPPSCLYAVMRDATGGGCGLESTRQVVFLPVNISSNERVIHALGNVWEWVDDWYAEDTYATGKPPTSGDRKVQRGGGWSTSEPAELRISYRASFPPGEKLDDVGFRCAADPGAITR